MAMPEISTDELKDLYQFAIHLAKDAGQILLEGINQRRAAGLNNDKEDEEDNPVEKENAVDIVTKTDNCIFSFLAPNQDL